jgi:hypothetical protein
VTAAPRTCVSRSGSSMESGASLDRGPRVLRLRAGALWWALAGALSRYLARPGRENGQSGDRESCYADRKSGKDRAGAKGGDLRAALLSAHLSQSAGHQKDVLACQWRRFKVRISWRIGAKTAGKSLRRLIGAAAGAAVSRCRNRLSDQLSAFAC